MKEETKTKLDTTSQQYRLAQQCRVSALAAASQSFAGAVYQQIETCFLKKIVLVLLQF
jgi:hypothetical protein